MRLFAILWLTIAPALAFAQAEPAGEEPPATRTVGARFVFRALRFAHNTAELDSTSYVVLKVAAERLAEVPDLRIRIEGHTDETGDEDYNLRLSERRAESVKKALVALGVAGDRIETRGRGEGQPIEPNDTREGRAVNRRVEFVVIE